MSRQPPKKSKGNKKALLPAIITVVVLGLTIVLITKTGIIVPAEMALKDTNGRLQSLVFSPFSKLKLIWKSYLDLVNVREENEVLKAQLAQLENEITTYREALIENRRLKQLLDIKESAPWKGVVAHVIGTDIASWRAVITIDAGKENGIDVDMPVLCQGGLLGRVIESSMAFSKVMLLTDYHSRVAALVQRNRARGIIKGEGSRGCKLDYVKKGVDIQVGDTVVTSGLDGVFPKGLLVGKVKAVGPGDRSDLFQYIAVKPSAKIDEAEEVLVLLRPQKQDE
ncbi:MAG: rod shape-determining protein MreC [Thermodesulfobacteria bacterium]|nr:rod shape-determining protein MreC [Thermodesulfobacteriota bacterium]